MISLCFGTLSILTFFYVLNYKIKEKDKSLTVLDGKSLKRLQL